MPSAKITNISSTSGMTRSGRIFAAPELPARSKDKRKADICKRERANPTTNNEAPVGKIAKEGDDLSKREIPAEEVTKFFRTIQ